MITIVVSVKKKGIDSLILKYFEIYKYKEEKMELYPDAYFQSVQPFDDYMENNYCIDSYGVFMMLFGNTMDTKNILKS